MAQLGTIKLQTDSGIVDVPVFDVGDSGGSTLEALRVQTDSGIGFVPLVEPADAASPQEAIRVQTDSGVKAVTDSASANPIPDSAVANYDATEMASTGSISSIPDQIGSFDLSGNCDVISDGINGQQTFRFDGSEFMANSDLSVSTEPFAVLLVGVKRDAVNSNNVIFDGGSGNEFAVNDDNSVDWAVLRGTGFATTNSSTPDNNLHIYDAVGNNSDDMEFSIDGSSVIDGDNLSAANLSGITVAARADGSGDMEIDIGEITILEGISSGDLQAERERLAGKWGASLT